MEGEGEVREWKDKGGEGSGRGGEGEGSGRIGEVRGVEGEGLEEDTERTQD